MGIPWWVSNYISMNHDQIKHEIVRLSDLRHFTPDRQERLAFLAMESLIKDRRAA